MYSTTAVINDTMIVSINECKLKLFVATYMRLSNNHTGDDYHH